MANLDAKTLPAAQANNSHRLFLGNIPCFQWMHGPGMKVLATRLSDFSMKIHFD